jgi:rRNA maturation RNase YbeY
MNPTSSIQFHYIDQRFHFPNRNRLKDFLFILLKNEGRELDAVNVIFCDDAYLLGLNLEYLDHDTYTDIITFELSEPGQPVLSDIFISVERVKANAIELRVSFQQELHRVIFHGFLHLCGYTDKDANAQKIMRRKEAEYLQSYFVPRGTTKTF